jgi:hypothetical protein
MVMQFRIISAAIRKNGSGKSPLHGCQGAEIDAYAGIKTAEKQMPISVFPQIVGKPGGEKGIKVFFDKDWFTLLLPSPGGNADTITSFHAGCFSAILANSIQSDPSSLKRDRTWMISMPFFEVAEQYHDAALEFFGIAYVFEEIILYIDD